MLHYGIFNLVIVNHFFLPVPNVRLTKKRCPGIYRQALHTETNPENILPGNLLTQKLQAKCVIFRNTWPWRQNYFFIPPGPFKQSRAIRKNIRFMTTRRN